MTELGGVPILIKAGDMSNTIPDEKVIWTLVIEAVSTSELKVTATFVGYLAARLLDLSREIKAARIIQVRIGSNDFAFHLKSLLSSSPGGRLPLKEERKD